MWIFFILIILFIVYRLITAKERRSKIMEKNLLTLLVSKQQELIIKDVSWKTVLAYIKDLNPNLFKYHKQDGSYISFNFRYEGVNFPMGAAYSPSYNFTVLYNNSTKESESIEESIERIQAEANADLDKFFKEFNK